MFERERKFLVAHPPEDLARYANDRIRQGYLAVESYGERSEVRVRRIGHRYLLTLKRGRGEARTELELPLPEKRGRKLWRLTRGRRIEKRRYRIPFGGLTIELDVYGGNARGLCVAEVEFGSTQASREFRPPPWFDREVTGWRRYANSRIAEHGWK